MDELKERELIFKDHLAKGFFSIRDRVLILIGAILEKEGIRASMK